MEEEYELSDYRNIHDLRKKETKHTHTEQPGRRLLLYGILTLGFLCIIQAALNVSLRIAFLPDNSKEDTDPFPVNILSKCQEDQNSTQLCSCYISQLRKLLRNYKALQKQRDLLQDQLIKLMAGKNFQDYGSGYQLEYDWDTDEYL